MILNLRCACCGEVKRSQQDTDELLDVEAEDICPHCFICADCGDLSDSDISYPAHAE